MKNWKEKLNDKYLKICIYAIASVMVTAILLMLLYLTGGVWSRIWQLFLAVLRPVLIGGILCYLLSPLVNKIEKILEEKNIGKSRRSLAVIIGYLMVFIIIIALLILLLLTVFKSVNKVNIEGLEEIYNSIKAQFAGFWNMLERQLKESGFNVNNLGGKFTAIVSGVSNAATSLLFGIISSIYLLIDGDAILAYWKRVYLTLNNGKENENIKTFLNDANTVFSGYIRGQFLDAFIVGIFSSIALLIAGVPSAVIVGIMTGLGNLIPYMGPIIGYCTVVIVCLPEMAWFKMLIGLLMLFAVMFIDGNIINPRLLSNSVKVHPFLVVVALIGGGAIGGLLGMIIAVPVAALLKIQLDRFVEKRNTNQPV